mgnify:CR=1 FL=1
MKSRFPLNKTVTYRMAVFHLGALAAPFFFSWNHLILGLSVWTITSSLGIGVGYHRLLTHKGFKTYKWVEYTLATIGALAQQGIAVLWVALHKAHHAFTEQPGLDPHTPLDGRWWSHMDWMIHSDPQLLKRIDLNKWVPELKRQPFYRKRYMGWVPTAVLAGMCFLVGSGIVGLLWTSTIPTLGQVLPILVSGVGAVLWGVNVPIFLGNHQTWAVNSWTHMWGRRRYDTDDDSRNSFLLALLTHGEGWHNNHHQYQRSARHGHVWYEIDVNWYIIKVMEHYGLAWDIQTPNSV